MRCHKDAIITSFNHLSYKYVFIHFLTVVLDDNDVAMIEFNIVEYHKRQLSSNNLPAFDELFNEKRHSNHVNRLHTNQTTDYEDDEESNHICRKGKRGKQYVLSN